ncbi:MAG: DUF499 domain-containing protein, partial [Bryobacteraceae bacterium]
AWDSDGSLRRKLAEWTKVRGKSSRLYPASLIWCIRKPGRELRDRVEELLAWQRVQKEISDGTIGGEFETAELREVASKFKAAEENAREEVWASYRYIAFADPKAADGLGEIDLGAGHSSGAKSLCERVIGALKSNALLNESPGAGYLERRWPEAFKETGAWPLKSLRQALLDGSLDRVINPDEYLKRKIPEFVAKGDFGLASGNQAGGGFIRIWFSEPLSNDEVSFDADVYLLKRDRAKAVRDNVSATDGVTPSPEAPGSEQPPPESKSKIDAPPDGDQPRTRTLLMSGSIPPESWNKVGIRLIPKLRSTAPPSLGVSFSLEIDAVEADYLLRELRQALADLGLEGRIEIRLK